MSYCMPKSRNFNASKNVAYVSHLRTKSRMVYDVNGRNLLDHTKLIEMVFKITGSHLVQEI